jgi:hypothetical protein
MSIYKANTILNEFPKELIEKWDIKINFLQEFIMFHFEDGSKISILIKKILHIGTGEDSDCIEIECEGNYKLKIDEYTIFTIIL